MKRIEILERMKDRINSCWLDLIRASDKGDEKAFIDFHGRLDELMLLYSFCTHQTFCEVCEEMEIIYGKMNENLKEFKSSQNVQEVSP